MSDENLSGPQWFLRFAWPCAFAKLVEPDPRKHRITQAQYDELARLIKTRGEPPIKLLEDCFPAGVLDQHKYMVSENLLCAPWFSNTVFGSWLVHKGMGPGCETMRCTVRECQSRDITLTVNFEGKTFPVFNLYGLPLYQGEPVLVHGGSVITTKMTII